MFNTPPPDVSVDVCFPTLTPALSLKGEGAKRPLAPLGRGLG